MQFRCLAGRHAQRVFLHNNVLLKNSSLKNHLFSTATYKRIKNMANLKLDNYIIVDVGANLTNKKFSRDLDAVIQR